LVKEKFWRVLDHVFHLVESAVTKSVTGSCKFSLMQTTLIQYISVVYCELCILGIKALACLCSWMLSAVYR